MKQNLIPMKNDLKQLQDIIINKVNCQIARLEKRFLNFSINNDSANNHKNSAESEDQQITLHKNQASKKVIEDDLEIQKQKKYFSRHSDKEYQTLQNQIEELENRIEDFGVSEQNYQSDIDQSVNLDMVKAKSQYSLPKKPSANKLSMHKNSDLGFPPPTPSTNNFLRYNNKKNYQSENNTSKDLSVSKDSKKYSDKYCNQYDKNKFFSSNGSELTNQPLSVLENHQSNLSKKSKHHSNNFSKNYKTSPEKSVYPSIDQTQNYNNNNEKENVVDRKSTDIGGGGGDDDLASKLVTIDVTKDDDPFELAQKIILERGMKFSQQPKLQNCIKAFQDRMNDNPVN